MFSRILILSCLCFAGLAGYGQVVTECPVNIGFESGNLANWECAIGNISQTGNMAPNAVRPAFLTLQASGAIPDQHTVIAAGGKDYYGEFSTNAPNGSDYVVKLGNDIPGRGAERISYTIDVPANVDDYSIIFNYAVVFESPTHDYDEQPKFTARVFDVSSNTSTECGSFEFVASGGLPGFAVSPYSSRNPSSGGGGGGGPGGPVPVLYKEWSPVLVNLSAYLGRRIRLEFTTNDCSLGGHFGYAYIDFDENCSIPITGNITCPGIQSITLKTLPGFFGYRWYNAETSELLGTADSVVLSPVPPIGTRIAIELIPYPGLGCQQILYTTISGMAMNIIDPPPDCFSVDLTDFSLKAGNSSDLTYTYWTDALATIPLANPRRVTVSGTYYIKGRSSSGCVLVRPVRVSIIQLPPLIQTRVLQAVHPATVDLTTAFIRDEEMNYSFWRNSTATIPIPDPARVGRKGTYYIKTTSAEGCISITPISVDIIIPDYVIPNMFTPNGDGVNDELTVLISSSVEVKYFKIFNRWGDVVYITSDIDRYWTGFRDTSQVPVGVYYWVIDGIQESKRYLRSGYVTLVR